MREIKFTIKGNQDDPLGNPYPYARILKGSKKPAAVKYRAWGVYVRTQYHKKHKEDITLQKLSWAEMSREKPLTSSKECPAKMDIEIFFANDARGDCDNIYKGIADALFHNDKYIMEGSFKGIVSPDKVGLVNVRIEVA